MVPNRRQDHTARRWLTIGLVLLAAAGLPACGGSDEEPVAQSPRLMTISDLRKYKSGTPEAALMRHLFFIQWGSARNLIASIDPAVSKAVGVAELIDGYAFVRPALANSKLRIIGTLETSEGPLVTFEVSPATGPAQPDSILFGRSGGSYVIRYDTQLDRGIPGSLRAATAGQPQSKQFEVQLARRIRSVMHRYYEAAGGAALQSALERAGRETNNTANAAG